MEKKLKLVAIAKDEAAYLPEWIYHHLSIGFDEIEVLVNYTTDNSLDVLEKISRHYPVKYRVIDNSIVSDNTSFQVAAYQMAVKELSETFDYFMFLDIDEFWVDSKGEKNIKDLLLEYDYPEALSFQWGVKIESGKAFDLCFSEKNWVVPARLLKVLFKVNPAPEEVNVHRVKIGSGRYLFSNGEEIKFKNKAELDEQAYSSDKISRYFIVHRMYRSEMEYVSLLGRGRPKFNDGENEEFSLKSNRGGYKNRTNRDICFYFEDLDSYSEGYSSFIKRCDIESEISDAQIFIQDRYQHVIDNVVKMPSDSVPLIKKVFKGVSLPEVVGILSQVKGSAINDEKLKNLLRDAAILIEDKDLKFSLELMQAAKKVWPNGKLISKKISEYKSKLNDK